MSEMKTINKDCYISADPDTEMCLKEKKDEDTNQDCYVSADPDAELCLKEKKDEDTSDSLYTDSDEGTEGRDKWSSKLEYILSMVGYCVGLGNVWRFPYVCMRNGGGAFLIPFMVCLTFCGMPLYVLEVSMGQFVSLSPFHVWSICPLFKGIGISMNILSFLACWYYIMILSWSLMYLANSVRAELPWTSCGQWWNTVDCVTSRNKTSATLLNITSNVQRLNGTTADGPVTGSSEEFWKRYILRLSPSLGEMGPVHWESVVALVVASIIVFICIARGIRSSGKAVYITATVPYILLVILIIKGVTLEGAWDGIEFYITPDFSKLFVLQTWIEASNQVFWSLGPIWGCLITMASYNKFNNNCFRDAVILSFVCESTSVFAGFAIFSVLGHMAYNLQIPVANFTDSGPGLAFVVYPEAISYLPLPQLWCVLFFFMLFTLGLDTQFAMAETFLTTVSDMWPRLKAHTHMLIKAGLLICLFLASLPFATEGGMYLFQLVDWYFASIALNLDALFEVLVVNWIYGSDRFLNDMKLMIGYRPPYLFVIIWKFITPAILLGMFLSTLMSYGEPTYYGYEYQPLELAFGKILACVPILPIPLYMVYILWKTPGSFVQRLKTTCSPSSQWTPAHKRLDCPS